MTFICWDKAYAVFPQVAFIDRADQSLDSSFESGVACFHESDESDAPKRHSETHHVRALEEYLRANMNTIRYADDRNMWTISFDTR